MALTLRTLSFKPTVWETCVFVFELLSENKPFPPKDSETFLLMGKLLPRSDWNELPSKLSFESELTKKFSNSSTNPSC